MFRIAYLDPNEIDVSVLSERFPTAEAARSAFSASRAGLPAESPYYPGRCIVLEWPARKPVRYQIVYHDARLESTWEGIPSNGRRFWNSQKAARIALNSLIQKTARKKGSINLKSFEVEDIEWLPTRPVRRPYGRHGRRVPWTRPRMLASGPA